VARTIAALEASPVVEAEHLAEALAYRRPKELQAA
jgi:predicted ATPase with chaperone activity